jgi:hypothetical protein
MKHLFLFEEFDSSLNEGIIPVYNEKEFIKDINTKPIKVLQYSGVIPAIKEMLEKKERGEISKIHVIAEVPTQGEGAPEYVKDIIAAERVRLAKRWKSQIGKEIDPNSKDFDFDVDRFGDKSSIFFDSEFIVDGVESVARRGKMRDLIVGIPVSLKNKGYKAYIDPIKVDEIYFTPSN